MVNAIKQKIVIKNHKVIFFAAFIVFFVANVVLWLQANELPKGKDASHHIYNFSKLSQIAAGTAQNPQFYDKSHSRIYNLLFANKDYPPVYYLVALLLKLLFGFLGPRVVLLTSCVFFIVMLAGIFSISEFIKKGSGLSAAGILSCYPAMYNGVREFNLDIAACAMVVLCFNFLLKSRDFEDKKYSLFFGASLGLGTLTRQTAPLFLIVPLVFVFFKIIRESKYRKARIQNMGFSLFLAGGMALSFYHNNMAAAHWYRAVVNMAYTSGKNLYQAAGFLIAVITQQGIGLFFTAFGVISAFSLAAQKEHRQRLVYLWAGTPFFLFPLILIAAYFFNELTRVIKIIPEEAAYFTVSISYILPVIPAFAIMGAVALAGLPLKIFNRLLYSAIAIGIVFSFNNNEKTPFFMWPKEKEMFKKTISGIGSSNKKVGVVSREKIDMYAYIGTMFFLWSDNHANLFDYYAGPVNFLKEWKGLDIIIKGESWQEQVFFTLLEKPQTGQYDVYESLTAVLKENFTEYQKIDFYENKSSRPVKIYVYKKKNSGGISEGFSYRR